MLCSLWPHNWSPIAAACQSFFQASNPLTLPAILLHACGPGSCVLRAANVHLQPNHHKELMDEVKAAAGHVAVVRELDAVSSAAGAGDGAEDAALNPLVGQLHHVETVDKSKPVIDASTHVQKVREGYSFFDCAVSILQGLSLCRLLGVTAVVHIHNDALHVV